MKMVAEAVSAAFMLLVAAGARAQDARPASARAAAPGPAEVQEAVRAGVAAILTLQEGDARDQWPYEGVYRVRGEIPVGYRVGGTAIAALALAEAPGWDDDAPRRESVARAVAFIAATRDDPQMRDDTYDGGYDVRAWGYIEATRCLARLLHAGRVGEAQQPAAREALAWYAAALQRQEIPKVGGWSYSRPPGRDRPGAPSSFMTAPALQALFEAARVGVEVDPQVVARSLAFLEKTRLPSGAVVYGGEARGEGGRADAVPGAVGRMACTEATLLLAGRGSPRDARAAVDAFLTHWDWLEARRAKGGTHEPPYMIAPYYFMFAHRFAAQCVEMLPTPERAEYRRRVRERLFATRADDGTWNDRVFRRSAGYGTAMALHTLLAPDAPPPARWTPPQPPAPESE
jgi:hypothetical protein